MRAVDLQGIDDGRCRSFTDHIEIIGRRWSSGVLLAGVRGARRFSEYRRLVIGISDRLLAQRLKELEREGLIERTVVPSTPVLIEYAPTERGRSLLAALSPLVAWADQHEAQTVEDAA